MCEEKRDKICLIPAPAGGWNFNYFNLCNRFINGFFILNSNTYETYISHA